MGVIDLILYALAAIGAGVLLGVTGMLVLEWVDRRFLRREAAKQAEQTWQDTSADASQRKPDDVKLAWIDSSGKTQIAPIDDVAIEPRAKPDPDLTTYIALAVPKTPSPTAKTSAAKVRAATKKRKRK